MQTPLNTECRVKAYLTTWAIGLGVLLSQSAWAVDDFSKAETQLFMTPHLQALKLPRQLSYTFQKSGSLEPHFKDHVHVGVKAKAQGRCCATQVTFLSKQRRLQLPEPDEALGQLFMATSFVKASGGCTAPATIDAQAALERIGLMNFKVDESKSGQGLRRVHWRLEHPNHSGLVMEQHTRLNIPAHYVQNIQVQFNGETVLNAEVDFSLSENPSLQFTLPSVKPGVLSVVALDSEGRRFEGQHAMRTSALQVVAPGVYAVGGDASVNRGNAGFIVGPQGVTVIDSGSSWAQGQDLIEKVRSVTALPIQLLLLTHAKDGFIFGASAFQDQGIPVHMHRDAARLMKARCATCLQQLQQRFGATVMARTRVPLADVLVTDSMELQQTGRTVRVLTAGRTSSPGALAVLDEQTGVIFAGAWLSMNHVPDVRDAQVDHWLSSLKPWLNQYNPLWVPGHGPVVNHVQAQQLMRYLQHLQSCVRGHVEQGTSLMEMDKACGSKEFTHWTNYDAQHPRNVVRQYLQTEHEVLTAQDEVNP